ncbi:MAG TPA: histidine phosphatase family protein [Nocardioidaceae bacterium]|nr:histidine phosphatase family protein [Nocardioidaceae bacterium]
MSEPSTEVWLVRHGETEWSRDRRHTSFTDLPLTENGIATAEQLGPRLAGEPFEVVLTSPMQRARRTAELAGFGDAEVVDDLVEWNYGEYEGITNDEIRESVPDWTVWTHPVPAGETQEALAGRLDRVVGRLRSEPGRCLLFAHGHTLRALTARWLGLTVSEGRLFRLDTATVSVLGYERETPVILRWNA